VPELLRKITSRLGERRLVWAVNLLLLVLVIQAVADLAWRWLEPAREEAGTLPVSTVAETAAPSPQALAQRVAGWHLFGRAQSLAATSRPTVAPETKLNLVLRGVIAPPTQENAVAIVAAGVNAADKSYVIGDKLPGGAKLNEIYRDRVIIEYRGRVETLTLHRKKLSNKELNIK
jgi:general secretion pathway protein C